MRKHFLIGLILLQSVVSGCYFGISGKVVDAETNQPIEGAVVLVEWTKVKGLPGMTHTESSKVIEVISDKDGKVKLAGDYDPMVDPPRITVYKKGYVAWNNEYIFPDYKKRNDFSWKNDCLFNMVRFKQGYSFVKHQSFIDMAASLSSETSQKVKFIKAYEDWEAEEVIKERNKK